VLTGPRQAGKTTLARLVGNRQRNYATLDDLSMRTAASRDPEGFVRGLDRPVTLDEVQRVPELVLAVKKEVDRNRTPGGFLLTGSASVGVTDGTLESLAGRAAVYRLHPFTESELGGRPGWNPLERLIDARDAREAGSRFRRRKRPPFDEADLLRGGFPEPSHLLDETGRPVWFEQYRRTYVERDVPLLVSVGDVSSFTEFVVLCAEETSRTFNMSRAASSIGRSVDTIRRWLGVMQATFLIDLLPAYGRSARKRLARSPKLHWTDTGLASHLVGARSVRDLRDRNLLGPLLETRVFGHLASYAEGMPLPVRIQHYRRHGGEEVDFIVDLAGRRVPIELKAGATIAGSDLKGLNGFLDSLRPPRLGILLYGGEEVMNLSESIVALPLRVFLGG